MEFCLPSVRVRLSRPLHSKQMGTIISRSGKQRNFDAFYFCVWGLRHIVVNAWKHQTIFEGQRDLWQAV